MPSIERGRSAEARCDVELAEWARAAGVGARVSQVRRWRLAGLLPAPEVVRERPGSAPLGRRARVYDVATLVEARAAVTFLAERARRGRSTDVLALLMYASGLPVPAEVVVGACNQVLAGARARVDVELARAVAAQPDVEDAMRLDDVYENAEAAAGLMLRDGSDLARRVRRNLAAEGLPADREAVRSTLIHLLLVVFGRPPEEDEVAELTALLASFGALGLVEAPSPAVGAVVPEGPSGLRVTLQQMGPLLEMGMPGDASGEELDRARDACMALGEAFAAIPSGSARRHLGGEQVLAFWDPEDAVGVAMMLTHVVALARGPGFDVAAIVDAVRAVGWLPG